MNIAHGQDGQKKKDAFMAIREQMKQTKMKARQQMSNEEKTLKLIIGDDGVLEEYNDEYDITIHCKSEAEAKEAMEKLEHINDLREYLAAITDSAFLEMNYGISDIDIQFVRTFNPDTLLRDYKEWKEAAGEQP